MTRYSSLVNVLTPIWSNYVELEGTHKRLYSERILFAAINEDGLPVLLEVDNSGDFVDPRDTSNFIGFTYDKEMPQIFDPLIEGLIEQKGLK